MESFVNVLNNDFETHQLYNPCTSHIAKIESSIKQDPTKLIQAREGFQKAMKNIMLMQGPINNIEKFEHDLILKEEDLLAKLRPIQGELQKFRERLSKHRANKKAHKMNKDFLYSSIHQIMQELKGPIKK